MSSNREGQDAPGEDLGELIAGALDDIESSDDPPSEVVEDPWTLPTAPVVPEVDRAGAVEAWSAARRAVASGQLRHARGLLEDAARLDPTDTGILRALEDVRFRERSQGAAPPAETPGERVERDQGRGLGRIALLVTALLAGVGISLVANSDERLPDLSGAHRQIAPFTELYQAPQGGWVATVDEPLDELSVEDQRTRCREIVRALPAATVPALMLRSTDGTSVGCMR